MNELLLLCQFLLLVAGWFLYLKSQQSVRDALREHSLSAESDRLRDTVDELLSKLVREAERTKQEIDARIGFLSDASVPGAGPPTVAAVYTLADEGCSPKEIARELARPVGEIELMLSVRRQSDDQAA
jgi:hypothetical protein